MAFTEFFVQAFVYLAAAVVAVPIARRLGLGSALGYLLAGVIIGPHVLQLVGDEGQDVLHFAEFGVVLMLFLVGLELNPAKLWRLRTPILGMGGLQVGLSAAAVGLACMWLGLDWRAAVAVGLILALSSTAIVLQTLQEKACLNTTAGKRAFSVLLFQDIAVIPILAVIPFLALTGGGGNALVGHAAEVGARPGWLQALLVVGVVLGIGLAGRVLARPVFRYIAETRSHEIFMATALLLIVGITLVMNDVGLSPALGTFMAGVVLADSEFRHQLEADIEPFKGLLLGLFFIAVGASIDLGLVAAEPLRILSLVAGLVAVKLMILYFLGRFFRLPLADALLFAFALAQGGEFAFLLVSFAVQNSVLTTTLANVVVVVVVLSMVLTPLMIILFERAIQPRLAAYGDVREEDEPDNGNPVIIAGYGRFGQIVGRLLKASGFEATLLDHDAGQVELTRRFGNLVFYGDASRGELLQAAGADRARLLVVAIDDRRKAVAMVKTARSLFPQLKVLARAIDRPHAYELTRAGADFIARETFGSALAVGAEALRMLGIPDARARRMAEAFERHDTEGMHKLYELWGDDQAYGFRIRQNLEQLSRVLRDDAGVEPDSAAGADSDSGTRG